MSAVPMAVEQHSYCSLNSVLSSLLILYYNRTTIFRYSTPRVLSVDMNRKIRRSFSPPF